MPLIQGRDYHGWAWETKDGIIYQDYVDREKPMHREYTTTMIDPTIWPCNFVLAVVHKIPALLADSKRCAELEIMARAVVSAASCEYPMVLDKMVARLQEHLK